MDDKLCSSLKVSRVNTPDKVKSIRLYFEKTLILSEYTLLLGRHFSQHIFAVQRYLLPVKRSKTHYLKKFLLHFLEGYNFPKT